MRIALTTSPRTTTSLTCSQTSAGRHRREKVDFTTHRFAVPQGYLEPIWDRQNKGSRGGIMYHYLHSTLVLLVHSYHHYLLLRLTVNHPLLCMASLSGRPLLPHPPLDLLLLVTLLLLFASPNLFFWAHVIEGGTKRSACTVPFRWCSGCRWCSRWCWCGCSGGS